MPDTPFLLKPREVAKAVRKAMAEGRLGYQNNKRACLYDYGDGIGCAIGVALPAGLVPDEHLSARVSRLRDRGIVDYTVGDGKLLYRLQAAHDDIINSDGTEERFIAALEACEAA